MYWCIVSILFLLVFFFGKLKFDGIETDDIFAKAVLSITFALLVSVPIFGLLKLLGL